MIVNERELQITLERIARMQKQVAELRRKETNPTNYRLAASGYLAEIDRMQLEVREYLQFHPADLLEETENTQLA
ncbi:hypothetical protein L0337_01305 [candidate division KSB1 bacterium]|nr:hypothetical protein [candidate division KSB1 bacterium]